MTRITAALGVLAVLLTFSSRAAAKTDEKEVAKSGGHLHYAHSYAAAMAEAKERGCVIFATIHEDG